MTALLDHLGLVAWVIAGVAALYLGWRLAGTRGLLTALAAVVLLVIYRKGRGDGREAEIEKERADDDQAVERADAARVGARVRDADPDRLRDDDGFKRRG